MESPFSPCLIWSAESAAFCFLNKVGIHPPLFPTRCPTVQHLAADSADQTGSRIHPAVPLIFLPYPSLG